MIPLAHVEAARVVAIGEVCEIDVRFGAHALAGRRCLLEGHAVLVALGDVEEGAAVGAKQPFVGGKADEVRVEGLDVEVHHADGVGGVDEHGGAVAAGGRHEFVEID